MREALSLAAAIAGWVGAVGTVGAYALVTQRRIAPDSLLFQGLNTIGAGFLALSAAASGSWPAVAVNIIWIVIGGQVLISARHLLKGRLNRLFRTVDAWVRVRLLRLRPPEHVPG